MKKALMCATLVKFRQTCELGGNSVIWEKLLGPAAKPKVQDLPKDLIIEIETPEGVQSFRYSGKWLIFEF
jgi:hypothetical protein